MLTSVRVERRRVAAVKPAAPQAPTPTLARRYAQIRDATLALCEGLSPDDCQIQSSPDTSPVKWHLAHTTWFVEAFVLAAAREGFQPWREDLARLFNSYYHGIGPQHPRAQRGLLSRPTLDEVRAWRAHVDAAVQALLTREPAPALEERIELGLQHEQQHQELILTDLKHALHANPLQPAYREGSAAQGPAPSPARWLDRPAVMVEIGQSNGAFAFDNERPRHRVWLHAHALASRTVTNGEYLEFMRDGGYERPTLWLSDGWDAAQAGRWRAPLYWNDDATQVFTLRGVQPLDPDAPVCHISYYEADAYARWAGARLPREAEWEAAAAAWPVQGDFVEAGVLHPRRTASEHPGFFGGVWEWTASSHAPYPGFRPLPGVLGEYNGKFMCNQMVLRGGSCASPASHLRASYRNFFPPHARWQFSGLRLAKDAT